MFHKVLETSEVGSAGVQNSTAHDGAEHTQKGQRFTGNNVII